MFIEEYYKFNKKQNVKYIHIVCDKCNRVNEDVKSRFKDLSYSLCNSCFLPEHLCSNLCHEVERLCSKCNTKKFLSFFPIKKLNKNGHYTICKKCHSNLYKNFAGQLKEANKNHDCQILNCTNKQKYCSFCKSNHKLSWFGLNIISKSGHDDCPLKRYIYSAKKRNLIFTIESLFFELVRKECFYCGYYRENFLNGIDRKNNNEGYTASNVAPCCSMCNKAKGSFRFEEWNKWLTRIKNHPGKR